MQADINPLLVKAIAEKRLVRLVYKGKERTAEPHDYGIHNGKIKLFAYQVGGSSSGRLPNWRWIEQELIEEIEILDRTFPGGRGASVSRHHEWDKLFIRVEPAEKRQGHAV